MIDAAIIIICCFIISTLMLTILTKLFANGSVDYRAILAASVIMLGISALLVSVPFTGWIISLGISMMIMRLILECTFIEAFLAVILWGGSIVLMLFFADQLSFL